MTDDQTTAGPLGEAGARLRALVAELREGLTRCRIYTVSYEHNGETRHGLGMLREDAGKVVARLEAELDALLSATIVSGWQPIETAPKDGTQIWTWDDERGSNPTMWVESEWWITYDDAAIQPTHWMPLPAAPVVTQEGE